MTGFGVLVFNECRRVTRNAHDAEDAAQLTFLAFAIELRSGTTIRRPVAWLQRVAHRQALKIVRARGRRKRREDAARIPNEASESFGEATPPEQALTAVIVRDAIDTLPDRHRLPIVLHYFGGMPLEAIAAELHISRTAAGTRLHRARKALANKLTARGLSFDAGTLSTVMAVLVPASVIAKLVRSSAIASEHVPFAISSNVGAMIKVSGQFTMPRIIAFSTVGFLAGGTAMGWQQILTIVEKIESKVRVLPRFDRLFEPDRFVPVPKFTAPEAPTLPSFSSIDSPRDTLLQSYAMPLESRGIATFMPQQPSPVALPVRSSTLNSLQASSAQIERANPFAFVLPSNQPISRPSSSAIHPLTFNAPRSEERPRSGTIGSGTTQLAVGTDDVLAAPRIELGLDLNDIASIHQTDGLVRTDQLIVGHGGRGTYDIEGGKLEVGSLTIGADRTSSGMMHIGGGTVLVTNPGLPVEIGRHGAGQLVLGSARGPGLMVLPPGNQSQLIVRATKEARGELRGAGKILSTGTLINNGRVVADGYGRKQDLDLSSFTDVENTIENPKGGTNGWYAENGGSVVLPPITVKPGTNTYTWGESNTDKTIDLVNSVRFRLIDQRSVARISINLISPDSSFAAINMPTNSLVYSLWSFNSDATIASATDLSVVYDQQASRVVTYHTAALQLLAFSNGGWNTLNGVAVDSGNNIITGNIVGSFSYFAVAGTTFDATASGRSLQGVQYIQPVIVVPEPISATLFVGALLTTGRRRRPL